MIKDKTTVWMAEDILEALRILRANNTPYPRTIKLGRVATATLEYVLTWYLEDCDEERLCDTNPTSISE